MNGALTAVVGIAAIILVRRLDTGFTSGSPSRDALSVGAREGGFLPGAENRGDA